LLRQIAPAGHSGFKTPRWGWNRSDPTLVGLMPAGFPQEQTTRRCDGPGRPQPQAWPGPSLSPRYPKFPEHRRPRWAPFGAFKRDRLAPPAWCAAWTRIGRGL